MRTPTAPWAKGRHLETCSLTCMAWTFAPAASEGCHLQAQPAPQAHALSCNITVMNSSASQEHDMYMSIRMWGRRREAFSPVQSSLKPCYKGPRINNVRTIWICVGAYDAAATHQYPTGASASLLSSLLRPNQAHVAWVHQAPGRAPEEGYN